MIILEADLPDGVEYVMSSSKLFLNKSLHGDQKAAVVERVMRAEGRVDNIKAGV